MLKNILLAGLVVLGIAVALIFFKTGSQFGPGLGDYSYQIAGNCTLDRVSAYQIRVSCDGVNKSIDAEVFQVGWNEQYLIANTHPVTKTDPNNPNCKDCDPDNYITYWWIIDLVHKDTYGPLSEQEFSGQKSKLGIPDLQLMSVDEAKAKGTWLYGDARNRDSHH